MEHLLFMYIYGHFKYVRWTKLQAPVTRVSPHHPHSNGGLGDLRVVLGVLRVFVVFQCA